DNLVKIIIAEEYEHPEFVEMVERVVEYRKRYGGNTKVYVDASNHAFIQALKIAISEDPHYEPVMRRAELDRLQYSDLMNIVPINFNQFGRKMLTNLQTLINRGWLRISQVHHEKLLTQMRIAKESNGLLKKTAANTMDLFDACRLAVNPEFLELTA